MAQKFKGKEWLTPSGVDLVPYMTDKVGATYLQVVGRVVWFRHDNPQGRIETKVIHADAEWAMFEAKVYDGAGNLLAVDYGSETFKGFPKGHIEKASTIAIGRALNLAGYGTAYAAADFNEDPTSEAKLADAPVKAAAETFKGKVVEDLASPELVKMMAFEMELIKGHLDAEAKMAEYVKRFKGRKRTELNTAEAEGFIEFLKGLTATLAA